MTTQTQKSGIDAATLGLGSVLVGSLPAALMTDDAPDRYTVEAVFTRRPERDEIAEILSGSTRELLAKAGYPTVELTTSDRRLEIANTNLEELRDGLGVVLAKRLAEISGSLRERRAAAALEFQRASEHESERAARVAALAESVSFDATDRNESPARSQDLRARADRTEINRWTDEGGRGCQ